MRSIEALSLDTAVVSVCIIYKETLLMSFIIDTKYQSMEPKKAWCIASSHVGSIPFYLPTTIKDSQIVKPVVGSQFVIPPNRKRFKEQKKRTNVTNKNQSFFDL